MIGRRWNKDCPKTVHGRRKEWDCRIPPGRSCLFAKTNNRLSFISRSLIIRCSSVRASSMRFRSAESTTKIRPWVPVGSKQRANVSNPEQGENGKEMEESGSLRAKVAELTAIVMSPERPDLVLSTDIPHVELDVLHVDRLNIEPNRRDRGHLVILQLECVQNCCLSRRIKSQHQDAHFSRPKQLADQARYGVTHGV